MKALILIDLQNDFFKNGSLEIANSLDIIPIVNNLIEYFNKNNYPVIATKDWHPKNHTSFNIWPIHCVQNTYGSEIHYKISKINTIIYKGVNPLIDSYSGFFDNDKKTKTELDEILKSNNIDTLYISGLATDFCVKYTVLDALDLGYTVFLITDACKEVKDSISTFHELEKAGAILIESKNIY